MLTMKTSVGALMEPLAFKHSLVMSAKIHKRSGFKAVRGTLKGFANGQLKLNKDFF